VVKCRQADEDSPWKEVLERYFDQFLAFFFPEAHAAIDWTKDHVFLDKELQKVVRDAALGKRLVDKLVQVHTLEGAEAWVLVHVEVQGDEDADFAKRMYVYNYRLFDRYDRRVASLAVLTDDRAQWRPSTYGYELWGCRVGLQFPVVKLLDYDEDSEGLKKNQNPFALVVLAHLQMLSTRHDPKERLQTKLALVRMLYERGYARQDILDLFRFIDWVMVLPEKLEIDFADAVGKYEEAMKMPYVTSVERVGQKRGEKIGEERGQKRGEKIGILKRSREAVLEILKTRFGIIPTTLSSAVNGLEDPTTLKDLLNKAVTTPSLAAFEETLKR
jgi:hypothetical protein